MERKINALDCMNKYRPCSISRCPAYQSWVNDTYVENNCLLQLNSKKTLEHLSLMRELGLGNRKSKPINWGMEYGRNQI